MTNAPKIIIAGNAPQAFKDKLAARLAKDVVTKSVPTYEIRKDPTPNSPATTSTKTASSVPRSRIRAPRRSWITSPSGMPRHDRLEPSPGCTDRDIDEAFGYREGSQFECKKCGLVIDKEDGDEWECIHCGTWNDVERDPDDERDSRADYEYDRNR